MIISLIENFTRICGQAQGYLGLPIRDEVIDGTPVMISAWEPTPEELAALNAGAKVQIHIAGTVPAPMQVHVGPIPA